MLLRSLASPSSSSFKLRTLPSLFKSIPIEHKRFLNLHEYESQDMMRSYGINVPFGKMARTPEDARDFAQEMNTQDMVLKAQVLTGGRGKGHFEKSGLKGGVHICNSADQVFSLASKMLGDNLITKQSGPQGKPCNRVYISQRHYIRRETYFAILLDRASSSPVLVASSQGGMDIEQVAEDSPEAIVKTYIRTELRAEGGRKKVPIPLDAPFDLSVARKLACQIGFADEQADEAAAQFEKMYKLFRERDATLLEINPLCETSDGEIIALDAKMNFDDNAGFRQKELFSKRDMSQEDPREVKAAEHDLNFIGLDGNIGCLVNGAGLAMATMDIIKLYGGSPANFLDIGGGATEEQVTKALQLLTEDANVRAILVNIFGGIMRCDVIALGLLKAASTINLRVPLVVRLQGTKMQEAKQLLENSGVKVINADDLEDAAQKAVKIANIMEMAQEAKLNVSFELPMI